MTRRLSPFVLVLALLAVPVPLRAEMTAADCQRFYDADAANHYQAWLTCMGNTSGMFSGGTYCAIAYAAWMAAAHAAYQGCMSSVR